ncbi:MAG TPA: CapA family protein [Micromonosporaceae bacterium]|nr:CapA family protein [Micromonosporaceae bacterium]
MVEPTQTDRSRPAHPLAGRTARLAAAALAVLVVVAGAGWLTVLNRPDPAVAVWRGPPAAGGPPATATPLAVGADTVTLSATGDIILGNAPGSLPPNGGRGFFAAVKGALAADFVMGNLEEPLTDDTGYDKCRPAPAPPASPTPEEPDTNNCHQFRAPPGYAAHLRDAGFDLLNQANNHGYDYGAAGYRNTQRALEQYGLLHTGAPDQITVATVKGIRIAVLGFSSYPWSNPLLDVARAKAVVARAAARADLVVVQVHMGAEGAGATHVRPGSEIFLGEDRGDPVRFSRAVVDAGADLVVGHGPHVLRGMEFYRGRLVAYSLGNFCGGGGTLNSSGNLGISGVLKVSLRKDGGWAGGSLISTTHQGGGGLPRMDPGHRGAALVRSLSTADFRATAARLTGTGQITPPGR